jgi:hypothetical protein
MQLAQRLPKPSCPGAQVTTYAVLYMRWPFAAAGSAGLVQCRHASQMCLATHTSAHLQPHSLGHMGAPAPAAPDLRVPASARMLLPSNQRRVANPSSFHTLKLEAGPCPWAHHTVKDFKRDSGGTRGAPGGTRPEQAPPERLHERPADGSLLRLRARGVLGREVQHAAGDPRVHVQHVLHLRGAAGLACNPKSKPYNILSPQALDMANTNAG